MQKKSKTYQWWTDVFGTKQKWAVLSPTFQPDSSNHRHNKGITDATSLLHLRPLDLKEDLMDRRLLWKCLLCKYMMYMYGMYIYM